MLTRVVLGWQEWIGGFMAGFGWMRGAVAAALGAALVVLVPTPPAVAVGDITLTFTISSTSGATTRFVDVFGPNAVYSFDETDGTTLTVTGPPGEYSVSLDESGGPQGDWSFYGYTDAATYAVNATVPVTVPLHSLALQVENSVGAPAQADVSLQCSSAHPDGWRSAETSASRTVNGSSSLLVVNHAAGDDPCDLTVDPVTGASGTALVPGNASTFTYVVQDAITLTYNLTSSSGATSRDVTVTGPGGSHFFDETGGNTLTVTGAKGPYSVDFSEYGGPQGDWTFHGTKGPTTYTADATVPVTVPLHSLVLDVQNAGGSPAQAAVNLACPNAHPAGWTSTQTYAARNVNGPSTFLVTNHAAADAPCSLTVDPVVGLTATVEVPGNATAFTYVVTTNPDEITLTFNLSSVSGAADRLVRVFSPDGFQDFDETAGNTFSVTGPKGPWEVLVYENGGPQGSSWTFSGRTTVATYTANATVPIAVPLHTLALDVAYPGGAPAPAAVSLDCRNGEPTGWTYASTSSSRDVNGVYPFLIADPGTGGDCDLAVHPVSGPVGYATVPGSASSFNYVVQPGAHVSGIVSDGLGNSAPAGVQIDARNAANLSSGTATTNAAGQYDLLLGTGAHRLSVSFVTSPKLQYSLGTTPVNVASNAVLNLAPVTDPLTVHLRTPGGAPLSATVRLDCSGTPLGQTLVDSQTTSTTPETGTDFVLPATATTNGSCSLDVDPTVGVRQARSIVVPNGGDEVTVVVDPGITVTGQVTVPDPLLTNLTGSTVTWAPNGYESATVDLASNGNFTFTGVAAGPGIISVHVNKLGWGTLDFQRAATLAGSENLALSPHLDFLDLYLLDPTGNPGTGTATLTCSGSHTGDVNSYTSITTTRSGTGTIRIPGYAADAQTCLLTVKWSDSTVVNRTVTLDPSADTQMTLLRNGVTLLSDPFTSNDDDGVADALEAYAPNVGDGNTDGTPDYLQAEVSSLPEDGGILGSTEDYLTVQGPPASALSTVVTDAITLGKAAGVVVGPPDGTLLPRGFLDFTVKDIPPGSTQKVVVHYQTTSEFNSFSTFDPGPSGGWSQLPSNRVTIKAKSIELMLTDGGIGDVDGAVNGRIRHPGGGTKVDLETPVVVGRAMTDPNDKGWYSSNVTVKWTVTDDKDTIIPPANTVVSTEGDDVLAKAAPVCDRRGNCSTGKLEHLKIDKTKPVVSLTGPAGGATYVLGAVPSRQCSGSDPGGSGVPDGGACAVTVTGGTGVGTITVAAKATDRAGNTATKTISYEVVYKAGGLVAPAAGSDLKVFKQGSTVVVRLKLLNAAGAAVTPAKAPVWVTPVAKGKSKGKPNQPVSKLKPDKGTVLIKRGSFWEYRWETSKTKVRKAYVITVRLDDGTTRTVTIGIG